MSADRRDAKGRKAPDEVRRSHSCPIGLGSGEGCAQVTLEQLIGCTVNGNNGIASCDPREEVSPCHVATACGSSRLPMLRISAAAQVAYVAGATVVVYNVKRNCQTHFLSVHSRAYDLCAATIDWEDAQTATKRGGGFTQAAQHSCVLSDGTVPRGCRAGSITQCDRSVPAHLCHPRSVSGAQHSWLATLGLCSVGPERRPACVHSCWRRPLARDLSGACCVARAASGVLCALSG